MNIWWYSDQRCFLVTFSKHNQKWGLHTVPFWYIYIYYAWTGKVFLWLFVFVVLKTPDASQNQYSSTGKFCDFVLWSTVRNSTPRAATKVYLMRFTTIHLDILDWIVVPVANRFFEHDVLYVVDVVLLGANRLISTGTRKDETTLDAVLLRIRACKVNQSTSRWLVTCHSQAAADPTRVSSLKPSWV